MKPARITLEELVSAMFKSADACLRSFGESNNDKIFYTFGIETYAVYGYFHMALNTHEDFEEYARKCRTSGIPEDDIKEEKWDNPQSWSYFSFNDEVDAWKQNWSEARARVEATIEDLSEIDDDDAFDRFCDDFKRAGVECLRMLEERGSFASIKTTDDFKTLVYEHSDVF